MFIQYFFLRIILNIRLKVLSHLGIPDIDHETKSQ